jgi:hypothetical protein
MRWSAGWVDGRRKQRGKRVAECYEYFVDLVATAPLNLLTLGGNASDLGRKGFRLVGSVALPPDGGQRGPCLLLFWERAQPEVSGG